MGPSSRAIRPRAPASSSEGNASPVASGHPGETFTMREDGTTGPAPLTFRCRGYADCGSASGFSTDGARAWALRPGDLQIAAYCSKIWLTKPNSPGRNWMGINDSGLKVWEMPNLSGSVHYPWVSCRPDNVFVSDATGVVALDPSTGRTQWRLELGASTGRFSHYHLKKGILVLTTESTRVATAAYYE